MRWLLLLLLLGPPARAEELVLGLSASEVDITATFDGSDILVFGAVKRDRPSPGPLDVAVAVSGPLRPLVVRHAERTFGIWVNTASVAVDAAPSFYAVATTRRLAREEGVFAGMSSGGAVWAALKLLEDVAPGAVIACIICDRGDRYLSSGLFA